MFTPIGYFTPQITWTPEDMNGITHWWRSDLGVTLAGSTVTSWVDQIAGKTLTQEGSSTAPDFLSSDSTMNNQPAIQFGNGGTTTDALTDNANRISVLSTDYPFMWAVFSTEDNVRGGYQIPLGQKSTDGGSGQEFLIEFNHPSYANTISTYNFNLEGAFAGNTDGNVTSRPNTGWIALGVDNNDANNPGDIWVNGTKTNIWATGVNNQVNIALSVGNYGPSGNLGYVGRIFEVGFCLEAISAESQTNFHTYLNARYGTSL